MVLGSAANLAGAESTRWAAAEMAMPGPVRGELDGQEQEHWQAFSIKLPRERTDSPPQARSILFTSDC